MLCKAIKVNRKSCGQTEIFDNGYCKFHQNPKFHQESSRNDTISFQKGNSLSIQSLTNAIPQIGLVF